jgi:hypothetical protein
LSEKTLEGLLEFTKAAQALQLSQMNNFLPRGEQPNVQGFSE